MKKRFFEVTMNDGNVFTVDRNGILKDDNTIKYLFMTVDPNSWHCTRVDIAKFVKPGTTTNYSLLVYKKNVNDNKKYSSHLIGIGSTKLIRGI